MSGHVFVVRSDITRLACDDWLLPGDRRGPGKAWRGVVHERPAAGAAWLGESRSVLPWPAEEGAPRPWLVHVGTKPKSDPGWHIRRVRELFAQLERQHRQTPPGRRRERHLVAVPLVGTGRGGASKISGEMVKALLDTLLEIAARSGVDVALVLYSDEAFHAAQAARRALGARAWAALDEPGQRAADALAEEALAGNLALFFGAGVSAAAGLPSWDDLLSGLAEASGLSAEQRAELGRLPPLDRAHLLEAKLGSQQRLFDELRRRLSSPRFSLAHALLAALPSLEAVTTNYDDLFEQACEAIERPVTVIPDRRLMRGQRWLLKLHGNIHGDPRDIVLTRQSYLRYGHDRAALSGTVAGLLLTRHMLFVGFSMIDDNFLRIADEVRRATRAAAGTGSGSALGTSLAVGASALHRELWGDELCWVDLGGLPGGARKLEIVLDRVLAQSTTPTQHLFDKRFEAMLGDDDRLLRDRLAELRRELPEGLLSTPAGRKLDALYRSLGWRRR